MIKEEDFFPNPASCEVEDLKGSERIEDGVWRPGILDEYENEVAVAASTKLLKRDEKQALRILGDQKRFSRPLEEKLPAGRILAQLRDAIDPSIDLHHIIKSQLANGGNVKKIDEDFIKDLEKGNLEDKQILKTDSLITNLKGYPLYVSAADCFPVGIYDTENEAIGLLHCGTYGMSAGVIENTLQKMAEEYGTDFSKAKVVIAPGISDEYVITKTQMLKYQENHPDFNLDEYTKEVENPLEAKFDLGRAIKDALIRNGVSEENIESSKYTTDGNNDLFPSDRKEGREKRDNYGFMIALKE
jgi:copper oxidase (laccase) domain-containing protein